MAPISGIWLALTTVCLLLCNVTVAQDPSATDPDAPVSPVDCENAVPAKLNVTLLLGTWYQAARKPVGSTSNDKQCYQIVAEEKSGNVSVHLTYSTDLEDLSNNQVKSIEVEVGTEESVIRQPIFNYVENGNTYTYKVLETDFESYAFACAYLSVDGSAPTTTTLEEPLSTTTTPTSTSTVEGAPTSVASSTDSPVSTTQKPSSVVSAGAFILTRDIEVTSPRLLKLIAAAYSNYIDFDNLSRVDQSDACRDNGSASIVPALAMIMMAVCSLLKVFH